MRESNTRKTPSPLSIALLGVLCLVPGACASAGPVIPDTTERVLPPEAREGATDLFATLPWRDPPREGEHSAAQPIQLKLIPLWLA